MKIDSYSIMPGAESLFYPGNEIGVLISHGFNGTPQSMRYIAEKISEAGYTVSVPRLKGHGTSHQEMEECSYTDWIDSLETAYNQLSMSCLSIFIMGQSMGGTLAIDLASRRKVDGVITLNAAFEVPGYEQYKHVATPRFIEEGEPDINDRNAMEITYTTVPLQSIKELLALIEATKEKPSSVHCPIIFFHSPEDHVVPAKCSEDLYHSVTSRYKKIHALLNSYHVASLDFDKDFIVASSLQFIAAFADSQNPPDQVIYS
ncbi:lipase [Peribacillus saganii]|uniref:Lipase n=1 Tax=Peribacillus saganii TaxID=2303992 RepID=A0A372LL13_9BACI|nr:alpha/beta fold hydrolase [Peribacillus saganii]RFU67402.1 lipase [Peribacillus saganii]